MKFAWREQWDEITDAIIREETSYHADRHGESLTEQRHTDDVNINVMVERFGIRDGASIPVGGFDITNYAETDDQLDLRTIIDRARSAQAAFDALPVKIRREFDHDPAKLVEFIQDPANAEKAVEIGLLRKVSPPGDTEGDTNK